MINSERKGKDRSRKKRRAGPPLARPREHLARHAWQGKVQPGLNEAGSAIDAGHRHCRALSQFCAVARGGTSIPGLAEMNQGGGAEASSPAAGASPYDGGLGRRPKPWLAAAQVIELGRRQPEPIERPFTKSARSRPCQPRDSRRAPAVKPQCRDVAAGQVCRPGPGQSRKLGGHRGGSRIGRNGC